MSIIYTMPDGGVAVTEPGVCRSGEPEAIWLDRVARKCCPPDGRLVAVMSADDLPKDRTHRDAWVWDGSRVVVDESRIRMRPAPAVQSAPAAQPAADPAPIRTEMHAEIARLRKDLSNSVEKIYTDLTSRIEERPAGQPAMDPAALLEQAESVIADRMDRAVSEAVRRVEERTGAITARQREAVQFEPGAIDEDGPLPHMFDDWRPTARSEEPEPEPETPEDRRERAIQAIARAAEERRGAVTSPYPGKRDYYVHKANIAFKQKMAPARVYTEMLEPEAKRKGLTVDQLCDRIIACHYEAEAALQRIHDAEAEGVAAVLRAPADGIVDAERAAVARIEAIGGDV